MRTDLSHWHADAPSSMTSENASPDAIDRLERDLKAVTDALGLLGVKRCSHCLQFFRCDQPGALFDFGQLVCFGCIQQWWGTYSGTTNVQEREAIERKLSAWLRKYHRAEVVKEGSDKQAVSIDFKVVTNCSECRGSGKLLEGQRCRFCNGLGTVWIVVPA